MLTLQSKIQSILQSNWMLYFALGIVLLIQLRLLWVSVPRYGKRFWIRTGLNIFVWLAIFLFVYQPEWETPIDTEKILLVDSTVPRDYFSKLKDSLGISESYDAAEFNRLLDKNSDFADQLGSVVLLGQDFSPNTLGSLSNKKLTWIPYFTSGQLQELNWQALVRKGDIQEINGKTSLKESGTFAIKYGNQVLDSIQLKKGNQSFQLRFPVFTVGQTQLSLLFNNVPVKDIHFFSSTPQPYNVLFVLSNPDFESKNLSEWLGKNNHKVEVITDIAKDAQSKVLINQSSKGKVFNADVVITDATNAAHTLIKKAVADGKSVLFINCTNPEEDAKRINQSLGTQWRVKKISNEQLINIGENLTAFPYVFENNINQRHIGAYPAAIQKKTGTVGFSLLNETFPLKLSGDSLLYNKIWSAIFQQLSPPSQNNVLIKAPVMADTRTSITVNNISQTAKHLQISGDSATLIQSSINPMSFSGGYIFRKSGWQTFQDSLSVYVENNTDALFQIKRMQEVLLAHENAETDLRTVSAQMLTHTLPDWVWLLVILLSFTALWLEPKFNY